MVTLGFVQSFLVSPGLAKIFYQRSDVEACNDDRNELRRQHDAVNEEVSHIFGSIVQIFCKLVLDIFQEKALLTVENDPYKRKGYGFPTVGKGQHQEVCE